MKKDLLPAFLIFILVLGIGITYLKLGIIFPIPSDAIKYYDPIALNIIKGEGFGIEGKITARVAPGYPFFLAIIYSLFGHNYKAVIIFQFLLLAGIGVVIYFLAKKYLKLSSFFSIFASITIVLWPYFILYSTLILTEILFTFFLVLSVFFLVKFQKDSTLKNAFLAGAFLGVATLVRSTILLLPLWLFVFFFFFLKIKKASFDWKKFTLFVFITFCIIFPWTMRNFIQFGKFIPVNRGLADSLHRAFVTYDYTQDSLPLEPGQASFKTLILARFKNFFLFWNPGVEGERAQFLVEKYPWTNNFFLIYKVIFFIILGGAFLSLRFIKKEEIFLLWSIILYFWALHTILYPYPRYTLPIIPLVILLAFYTFSYLSSRYRLKHISR